jgi:hypothetical protein
MKRGRGEAGEAEKKDEKEEGRGEPAGGVVADLPAESRRRRQGRKCLRLEEPDPPPPPVVHLEPPYTDFFHWGQLGNIGGGGGIKHLIDTGPGGNYCDEPVGEELVAEAQDLLQHRFDALVPRWYEHDEVTRQRRSEIERGFEASWPKSEARRVLDKADNKVRVFNSALPPSDARFEITYVDFDDSSIEYSTSLDSRFCFFVCIFPF